ncbi:MAG: 50S ribosomal protein L24 [Candidatus Methanofastidiosia archaeon]|jgi:large subunit ribosomal protein L24
MSKKNKNNVKWKTTSKHPKKQRKALFTAPLHHRRRALTASVSEDLQDRYGINRIPVKAKDKVLILRGDFAYVEGEVVKVDLKQMCLHIDGVTVEKADGSEEFYPVHASNVVITDLNLKDENRSIIIERKV